MPGIFPLKDNIPIALDTQKNERDNTLKASWEPFGDIPTQPMTMPAIRHNVFGNSIQNIFNQF